MRYDEERRHWQVDRHIPVAVLLAIVVQSIGIIAWAVNFQATTVARLDTLEKQIGTMATSNERLARLEAITATSSEILREIRTHVLTTKGR